MAKCTTHHYACDCREAKFLAFAKAVDDAIEKMSDAALRTGLEGTRDWDEIAGGADLFGLQTKARDWMVDSILSEQPK